MKSFIDKEIIVIAIVIIGCIVIGFEPAIVKGNWPVFIIAVLAYWILSKRSKQKKSDNNPSEDK